MGEEDYAIAIHTQSYIEREINDRLLHGFAMKKRLLNLHVSFPAFSLAPLCIQGPGAFPPSWKKDDETDCLSKQRVSQTNTLPKNMFYLNTSLELISIPSMVSLAHHRSASSFLSSSLSSSICVHL